MNNIITKIKIVFARMGIGDRRHLGKGRPVVHPRGKPGGKYAVRHGKTLVNMRFSSKESAEKWAFWNYKGHTDCFEVITL